MSTQDLSALSIKELTAKAALLGLTPKASASKDELIRLISEAPPAPQGAETITLTNEQLQLMLDQVAEKAAKKAEEKLTALAASFEAAKGPMPAAMPAASTDLAKQIVSALRGDKSPGGFAYADQVPGPEDILEDEAIFWCRTANWAMRQLMIGPVPQALPFGMDQIKFTPVLNYPIAFKRNPADKNPSVIVLCRFGTKNRVLAELLRKDRRYGTDFFEDVKDAFEKAPTSEYSASFQKHMAQLQTYADPSYVFSEAKKEGIPFGMTDDVQELRRRIAHSRAEKETQAIYAALEKGRQDRERERSLALEKMKG